MNQEIYVNFYFKFNLICLLRRVGRKKSKDCDGQFSIRSEDSWASCESIALKAVEAYLCVNANTVR